MTDFVYPDFFIPLTGNSFDWMLCRHIVIRERPPGSAAAGLVRTPPRLAMREFYGADANVPSDTLGAAFPFGVFAPAMSGDSEGQRRAGVSWRCDGR